MNPDYIPILTTLISVAGSFAVALLTWSVQMKKTRKEEHDEIMRALDEQKDITNKEIQGLKTDLFQVKSAVENKVSIIEIQIGCKIKDRKNNNKF